MSALRYFALAGLLAFTPDAVQAAEILIDVPGADKTDTSTASYKCGELTVDVEFTNAGEVSLAQMVIDGEFVVAANVMSGSGAKYAGGNYILWTKGQEAQLWDLTQSGEDKPGIVCEYMP
jgi:membrane-bound inhibitor of C-type lysozyme